MSDVTLLLSHLLALMINILQICFTYILYFVIIVIKLRTVVKKWIR